MSRKKHKIISKKPCQSCNSSLFKSIKFSFIKNLRQTKLNQNFPKFLAIVSRACHDQRYQLQHLVTSRRNKIKKKLQWKRFRHSTLSTVVTALTVANLLHSGKTARKNEQREERRKRERGRGVETECNLRQIL